MAVLKQCLCCSLRQGSFIIGSYALVVYCLAFAVELWWIIESSRLLPAPSFTLCAMYFFNFVMAATLLFGLLLRQRRYLMSWTLMTVLSFFPEMGLVLFMSLYYWPLHKYEYGVVELVFWSLRAIFNIFGILCVLSLYLEWRDEEKILDRLHDLTLSHVECEKPKLLKNVAPVLAPTSSESRLGFQNFAYVETPSSFLSQSQLGVIPRTRAGRSFANGSNLSGPYDKSFPSFSALAVSNHKSEFDPAQIFDPDFRKSFISDLGIAGIGVVPPGVVAQTPSYEKSSSMWNVTNDEFWNRPPPTRPVSTGYVNHISRTRSRDNFVNDSISGSFMNLSHNCRKNDINSYLGDFALNSGARRSHSVDALDHLSPSRRYIKHFGGRPLPRNPIEYSNKAINDDNSFLHDNNDESSSCCRCSSIQPSIQSHWTRNSMEPDFEESQEYHHLDF